MNGKQVIAKLVADGWRPKRVRGSHRLMTKNGKTIPAPEHGAQDLGRGLLAELERQTGVTLK
jgi:predicted RNA binding protein YcfA (HicA-like mRNA interferase family)